MSAKRTDMHRLQELVRLHRMGEGPREVCRLLEMSPKTEGKYRRALMAAGLLAGPPDALPALDELKAAVLAKHPLVPVRKVSTSLEPWVDQIRDALSGSKPPGLKALWSKLRREDPTFGASYSSMRRLGQRLKRERGVRPEDVVIRVETPPGDVAQVDFGYAGRFFDPDTGKTRKAWVFVMVLGYSRHLFARLVFDQSVRTWVELHVEAFAYLGGVPRTVVPDNLKAAIVRAAFGASDRHELGVQRSYRELARHYGFKIDPTPTYSPEKKGKVESSVKYVRGSFLETCTATDLPAANRELAAWLEKTAATRIHGTTARPPGAMFEAEERETLLALPTQRYERVLWKRAKVHTDSHVELGGRLYSVPWRHIGKEVWVRATQHSVEVYRDDTRIATHDRRGPRKVSTQEAHLPEGRRDLRHRSETYWRERATRLHPDIGAFVEAVFDSDRELSKLRDVQAIVTHLEKFPEHRRLAAVARARFYGNFTYAGVRNILRDGLDAQPLPQVALPPTVPAGERPRFARQPTDFLAHAQEKDLGSC